ncbi:hydroxymethylbilane synthase [Helicobacter pylori]|uniref:hydroxymethylbilane synthase n=1 Tax=Helicobacter pylori TaxID=210 RepID=UPI0002BB63AF|nr:hydroxymethylbilane synthase [Helicobacter pylori]EMH10238.1 hydroxymethylbilane synthase [Helicobacter pylori GAM250AFi]EMH14726.1 hydroxymethylbilane synthase [Helicobacter pylori GAM252Bi]EMH14973.1 hydroxymethylbilane synthase [Helicobacter pylori GAM250T]EMH15325.1 hydroxymethylbilane synthase [Helicobacter pylori GAM252T]EMH47705.1 hydroxymethylbilane synthase [Helicobacter pylori HP250AFii]
MEKLVIGSRGSELALWQANHIKERLKKECSMESEIQIVKTTGDKILDAPLNKIGGKGLFTKELEELLLKGAIDLAVHSLKDVPVVFEKGLDLACITKRADVRDTFLSVKFPDLMSLPKGAKVGTTSLRRSMQIKLKRQDLDTESLRGNVQTRLKKLECGEFDAIILAEAGLCRLNVQGAKYRKAFSVKEMIPSMGQGALGVEMLKNHKHFITLQKLNDEESAFCCHLEREFIKGLNGGCQIPVGVHANLMGDRVKIQAVLGLPNGKEVITKEKQGDKTKAFIIVQELLEEFLQSGAKEILEKVQLF